MSAARAAKVGTEALAKVSGKSEGFLRGLGGKVGRGIKAHPMLFAADAATFAPMLARGGLGAVEGIGEKSFGLGWEQGRSQQKALNAYRVHQENRARELRELTAQNLALMARHSPHTYNELAAGMRLPEGAAVFGGRKQTELLEEVAGMMSRGGFQPDNVDPVGAFLGG